MLYFLALKNLHMKNQYLVISFCIFSLFLGNSFSQESSINIDNTFYEKADIISIWGVSPPNPQNSVFVTIKDSDENIIWTEKLTLDKNGEFSTLVIAGTSSWSQSGTHTVTFESGEFFDEIDFFYDAGSQVNPPSVVDELYISQEKLILTFTIAIVIVAGIFIYLARNIILRKKTEYDQIDLDSKKDRDFEKYHSEWSEEEIFGSHESTIDAKEFREMYNENSLPNYYLILGLSDNSTELEIKNQYRKLAKEYHPDRNKDSSEEKMTEINKAYEVLSDKKLKAEYDKFCKLL